MKQVIIAARELLRKGDNKEALQVLEGYQDQGDAAFARLKAFAHHRLGENREAIEILQKAIIRAPEEMDLYVDMRACYAALGDKEMADKMMDMAASSASDESIASFIMQTATSQNLVEMKQLLKGAMQRYPDSLEVMKGLIKILEQQGRYVEALDCADKAVEINKISAYWRLTQAQLYLKVNQGVVGKERELTEANQLINIILDVYKHIHAFMLKDDIQVVLSYALEYERYEAVADKQYLADYWIHCPAVIPLMYRMDHIKSMQDRLEVMELHRLWGKRVSKNVRPVKQRVRSKINNKIRIGIMDGFEDTHVGRLLMPLLENWNKDKFELYCYQVWGLGRRGDLMRSAEKNADCFRVETRGKSNKEIAEIIAEDGLDALVDIVGGFAGPEIIAHRPAPVQISWLDYPSSNGLPMDYIMVDPYNNPGENFLLEKPLVLPETWVVMDKSLVHSHPIADKIPEDRNGYVTFGTMNSIYKFQPETFKVWAEIMHRVPNSRFLYARVEKLSQIFKDNFIKYMAVYGIDPNRIAFKSTTTTHLEEYNNIDIALDSFPRTGGTTTCESLWMGVPVVTLVGPCFFERLSYSNLNNVGLGDLCGYTVKKYQDIAVELAADKERRRYLRRNLRDILLQSPLGQVERFTKNFTDTIANVLGRG